MDGNSPSLEFIIRDGLAKHKKGRELALSFSLAVKKRSFLSCILP